ncbi:hypothetical protein [Geminocystis sp. NIES-3708]|uniref:hypothetical protein n=1 Tax=Geminocystis sp. NIES-3708 TaxID=1615909 RepID=UPI000835A802|nr:hypothetical protein [Geminocystis sp. NIES-3708]
MTTERNPSNFYSINVVDTCSIWHIISSQLLRVTAYSARCSFCCTNFVYYECLYKPREQPKDEDIELQNLLKQEINNEQFKSYHLDIEDLQEVEILKRRKKLGKGELTSIAYAKKTNQAFITDDQGARNIAEEILGNDKVQTTPHLLGWLFFKNFLNYEDIKLIIEQHQTYNGKLERYFMEMYHKALDYKLKQYSTKY